MHFRITHFEFFMWIFFGGLLNHQFIKILAPYTYKYIIHILRTAHDFMTPCANKTACAALSFITVYWASHIFLLCTSIYCILTYLCILEYMYIVQCTYPETKFVHTVHLNTYLVKTCTCYMTVATKQIQKRPCKDTIPFFLFTWNRAKDALLHYRNV